MQILSTSNAVESVQKICKPRASVMEVRFRDYALNLTDLVEHKIDAEEFFNENYITEGLNTLLENAFQRFEGKSNISLIKLTQAMGGGKTHSMIALALLAANPALRKKLGLKISFQGVVRTAAFSGRESDNRYGIWGSIARQLGKEQEFSEYFSTVLKAPGESAWIRLLQGDPLLILLDEIPPYLEYARSVNIGNSDLSVVTTTALANLIVAANKAELSNVLIVISDLKATYEGGSATLSEALKNLDNEVNRTALELEPVRQNSGEIYQILKSKLFEKLPDQNKIKAIAAAYSEELKKARQMGITNSSPEELFQQIQESYPFHPAIRDLYARFKENPGFQQTRGLIRLLRTQVRSLYSESRIKEDVYLLSPEVFDLNDADTVTEVNKINSTLKNAISHDIASEGHAEAEKLDKTAQTEIYSATTKTILLSSLALVQNSVLGLNEAELVAYLVKPGREIADFKGKILPALKTTCWYLHLDRQGNYLFRNTQNIVAKINSLIQTYNPDQVTREIRQLLQEMFKPVLKDLYQRTAILEAPDTIKLDTEQITLVIYRPNPQGKGIHPDLAEFYQNQSEKNRVLFLTGEKAAMNSVEHTAREIKAIRYVLDELNRENVQTTHPQYQEAQSLRDQYTSNFRSAVRETFTRLYYPSQDKLMEADFQMQFSANDYDGEAQIRETLKKKQKFTEDTESDTFRNKVEKLLFGKSNANEPKEMEWAEIKKRAARHPGWQWHRPDALDRLKNRLVREQVWRENGKFVQTGPFPPDKTGVIVTEVSRDRETGTVTLRIEPQHGDKVYYDFGAEPTTASQEIHDFANFSTSRMRVSFLCVDSSGKHPTGNVKTWQNTIDLKYETIPRDGQVFITLKAIPDAEIKYTTDGSHPREVGALYTDTFAVNRKCTIMAIASKEGIESGIRQFDVDPADSTGFRIHDSKPALVTRRHQVSGQNEIYDFIELVRRLELKVSGLNLIVQVGGSFAHYEAKGTEIPFDADALQELVQFIRRPFMTEGNSNQYSIKLTVHEIHFRMGADVKRFAAARNEPDYKADEVRQ